MKSGKRQFAQGHTVRSKADLETQVVAPEFKFHNPGEWTLGILSN